MNEWRDNFLKIIESLSKNNYSLLAKSKPERTFLELLKRAPSHLPQNYLLSLEKLCHNFDNLPLDEKKERLIRLKELILNPSQSSITHKIEVEAIPDLPTYRAHKERLSTSLSYIKGVGPKLFKKLSKKGLSTVEDILYFLPKHYEDRRKITPIGELREDIQAVVFGEILRSGVNFYGKRKTYEVLIADGTGFLVLKWFNFNEKVWRGLYPVGKRIYAIGEVKGFLKTLEMHHPETLSEDEEEKLERELGKIIPIYPGVENIPEKTLRNLIQETVKEYIDYVDNLIPAEILKTYGFLPLKEALKQLHLPDPNLSLDELLNENNLFYKSIAFEELFFLELGLALRKSKITQTKGIAFRVESKLVEEFLKKLPFELTQDQKRVIEEIKADMAKPVPMNRLIQGDVGCGKTVVAFIAALIAIENGYQVALMAPTEILAEQHYRNFRQYVQLMTIQCALLTGGTLPSKKREIYHGLSTGYIKFVIGTHALFQENVEFKNLGLVIIDEQHRFGVLQRAALREKAKEFLPDTLVMTATPIPRTLALTVYGDLEVSLIKEMPKGRKPTITKLYLHYNKEKAYEAVKEELNKGHQAYVILPLIEESENLNLKALLTYGEELKNTIFKDFKVEILHGKMSSVEKEKIMQAFKRGEIDVLISTTVVEVGVDVPNATVMVIEHAERFGLSQLHQLRGRVGRSEKQSYCFLIAYNISFHSDAYKRLQILCQTNDGFKIAEEDLKLRGPGEILGTQQSGFLEFKKADPVKDLDLLLLAKEAAFELIKKSPNLEEYPALKEELFKRWEERLKLSEVA
ncbi:MAG: ATP-dependent DNA helicase RecG [Caldimicrobium sp.]